jgi:hypothetical protein
MVEQLRAVPAVPLLAAAPEQYLLFGLTNGHSSVATETAVIAEEDPAIPAGETIDSLVRPLVESAKAAPVEAAPVEAPPAEAAPAPPIALLNLPTAEPPTEPAALPAHPTFVELAVPLAPPEMSAALVESRNPVAVPPPASEPPTAAKPNPFLARVAQIAELRIAARSLAKTAAPVESQNLPTPEAPAVAPLPKTEPVGLSAPAIKLVELAIPPNPPSRNAPRIEPAKLATAQPPTRTAPPVAEPALFPAPAPKMVRRSPTAAPSMKTAPRIRAGTLAAVLSPLAAAAPRVSESGPFRAANLQFPKLAIVPEPFCAAAGFADQSEALSEAFQLQAEAVLDEIKLGLDADESKIHAIVVTFQARPKLALLPAPSDILAAPAPPDLQWVKTPRPVLPARKTSDRKCDSATAPPQKLPLAGPCLPPELRNFLEAPHAEHDRSRKGIGLPGWITSLVIATSLFLVVAVMMQYLVTKREAKAAVAPTPNQVVASAPATPAFEQHPFARFVEVTGLRVVADLNHRSQVQYIVVNHSASQISDMTIRIAVRSSTDPAGAAPLFTVSAVVPSLGPHQSKEIRTDLDSQLRSSAIPDWEYLRTDVQVGTQN